MCAADPKSLLYQVIQITPRFCLFNAKHRGRRTTFLKRHKCLSQVKVKVEQVLYLLRCRALRFSRSMKACGVMKEMVFLDSVRSTSRVMFAKSFLFTLRIHHIRE